MTKPRCESIGPQGMQCGQPKGHAGLHGNGMAVRAWSDEQARKVIPAPEVKQSAKVDEGLWQ